MDAFHERLICDEEVDVACRFCGIEGSSISGAGGIYVQDCVKFCVPPVHPSGDEVRIVLVCVSPIGHVVGDQSVYVKDVQVGGGGPPDTYSSAPISHILVLMSPSISSE